MQKTGFSEKLFFCFIAVCFFIVRFIGELDLWFLKDETEQ